MGDDMETEKIKLSQAVIVEGKYDKIKLSSILDAVIITTDGFGIYKDKEKLGLIRCFAQKSGIIILTDSDGAGFQIRNHIKGAIKNGKIYNVYIPDIFGKEKRKEKPSKEGKLGVEGISAQVLRDAFAKAGIIGGENSDNISKGEKSEPITKELLLDMGFIGGKNSAEMRKELQKELSLPERLSAKALLDVLNALCARDEFIKAAYKIKNRNDRDGH